jgi:NADH-quinone oxidoreductase subunit N
LNLQLLLPEIVLAAFAIVVILADLFVARKGILAVIACTGVVASAVISLSMWGTNESAFGARIAVDNYAMFFNVVILGVALLVLAATTDYATRLSDYIGEYYALILTSATGLMFMAAGTDLITIYIGLELASISLYALAGFLKDQRSSEASLKYLLLGATASAVLLYGMALLFGLTGHTDLSGIASGVQRLAEGGMGSSPALLLAIVLVAAGFGFKIAAAPFHMWVPDVYEGAPTPVTAYLSVASKAAGFAVILRVFYTALGSPSSLSEEWGALFAALSVVSMTIGNLAAIPQTNIKRMFGYSSIAQAGYLMVGLAAAGASTAALTGRSGVLFFLAGYALTNLGAFIAIIAITGKLNSDLIKDFAGMKKRAPVLAIALTLCLISLIGMPPAVGFMGKFYIFSAAVQQGLLWLVIVAVINSVISAYYYLNVVKVMWFNEPSSAEGVPSSLALRIALGFSCVGVLFIGLAPGSLMKLAETAARMLSS